MFKAMLIKEFLLVSRDKHALAALFVMPAVFILIMSLALQDSMGDERAIISYVVVDHDQSTSSEALLSQLATHTVLNRQIVEAGLEPSSPEMVETQFIIELPKGFEPQHQPLLIKAAADASPSIVTIFRDQIAMAWMAVKLTEVQKAFSRGSPPDSFNPDDLMQVQYAQFSSDKTPNSTQQSVPSWIVFGLYFVIIPMSTIFINERKQNTMMRLSTMNISLPVLFGGKVLPYLFINQLQVWLMIAVGIYLVPLFGAAPLAIHGSLIGLFLVSISLSLSAIGLSILIATLVDSVEQATTIGGIINILLGAIGGVMVPKFIMPEAMQQLANISPMSWGLEGFLDIFLRQGTAMDVLNESLALVMFGLMSLGLAAVVFSYKQRKVS